MSSSNNTNKTNVPEAKEAMNRFKMEVANEIGVPLSEGYNGNLTIDLRTGWFRRRLYGQKDD